MPPDWAQLCPPLASVATPLPPGHQQVPQSGAAPAAPGWWLCCISREVVTRGETEAKCLSGDIDAIIISGKIITGAEQEGGGRRPGSFSDGKVHYV